MVAVLLPLPHQCCSLKAQQQYNLQTTVGITYFALLSSPDQFTYNKLAKMFNMIDLNPVEQMKSVTVKTYALNINDWQYNNCTYNM